MDALIPAVVLVARLLLMGPDGTQLLSEQRATIPAGATGLLRESPGRPNLPGSLRIYMTPAPGPVPGPDAAGPAPVRVKIRSEIWADSGGIDSGKPADEINLEDLSLQPGNAAMVQIAEDAAGGRRLILSLSLAPAEEAAAPSLAPPSSPPLEISLVVEAYRDHGGARDLLEKHVLRTLAGREVSWQSSWKRAVAHEGGGAVVYREEGLKLVVKPQAPTGGWISLEALLEATILPDSGEGEPRIVRSSAARTVPVGIPVEISLDLSAANQKSGEPEASHESYLVQITPYVQASGPGG